MVGGEEESLLVRLESADRIRRGELETEPDDSGLDRSDSALGFSAELEDGYEVTVRFLLRLRPSEETREPWLDGRSPETALPFPRDELLSREDDSAAGTPWLLPKLEGRICGCMDMVLEGAAF